MISLQCLVVSIATSHNWLSHLYKHPQVTHVIFRHTDAYTWMHACHRQTHSLVHSQEHRHRHMQSELLRRVWTHLHLQWESLWESHTQSDKNHLQPHLQMSLERSQGSVLLPLFGFTYCEDKPWCNHLSRAESLQQCFSFLSGQMKSRPNMWWQWNAQNHAGASVHAHTEHEWGRMWSQ